MSWVSVFMLKAGASNKPGVSNPSFSEDHMNNDQRPTAQCATGINALDLLQKYST